MKRKKKNNNLNYSKLILRVVGVAFVLIGIALSCFWFFWFLPKSRRIDPHWLRQFSTPEYWKYIQNNIHNYGWSHDDFGPVGLYGNKEWAEWIMAKAANGEEIANCGDVGHKDDALQHITNQDPVNGKSSEAEEKWLKWWSENKNKSQFEWIRDGFVKYGVKLSIPYKNKEYKLLLELLANKKKNKNKYKTDVIPDYVKYNAFRWLRDSGFVPVDYVLSVKREAISKDIVQGIHEFQELESLCPRIDGIGTLHFKEVSFKKVSGRYDKYVLNAFSDEPIRYWKYIVIYSIILFPVIIGAFLLFLSSRKKKKI